MHKAKRIFIVADISNKPIKMFIDQMPKLAKGLIRLGHDVRMFSYCNVLRQCSPIDSKTFASRFYKGRVDDMLASQVKEYCPDIVYVSFARVLDAQTVQRMRQAAPSAVFIGGDGDPWPQLQKNRVETAKKLDIVTATNDGQFLQVYRDAGVPQCVYMPNMCDPDIDHRYVVPPNRNAAILWTGKAGHSAASDRVLRGDLVERLAQRKDAALYGCFDRPKIAGRDYLYAISASRIGITANACKPVRLYHSDRLTHYLACGTMVLAEAIPDGEMLYHDNEHLRYFESVDECLELADWCLQHESERRAIADAGMKHVHDAFNCTRIAGYIMELVETGRYDAPWI